MLNTHAVAATQHVSWLSGEIDKRRAQRDQISFALDAFALRHRGIENFSKMVDQWMPSTGNAFTLFLARQIASVSLEHLCIELLARWLLPIIPVRAQTVEFTKDTWANSPHKQGLTSLPVLIRLRAEVAEVRTVKVVPKSERRRLSISPVLSSISAEMKKPEWGMDFQGSLPDLHRALRVSAGISNGNDYDISDFWPECLRATSLPPPTVFLEIDGKAERRNSVPPDFQGHARPPASWFYLLYLSMFVTGDRVLVATTIEEDDESIRTFFSQSIERIEKEVGIAPLIVWLPHHSATLRRQSGEPLDFTEINPAVFQTGWADRVSMPEIDMSCYDAADHLIHQIAML